MKDFLKYKNNRYTNEIEEIEHKYEVENKENKTTITIYGFIGDSWFGKSTSASDIVSVLEENQSKDIIINLNSGGGDAFDGIAIYNQLKRHKGKVVVNIDGFAASAASVIAMAADELYMHTGTMMMIHEASTVSWGTKKEIKATLNALEGLDSSLADIYMTRFKGEREEIEQFIENETWFTADEAVTLGLADQIVESEKVEEKEEVTNSTDPEEFKTSVLSRFLKSEKEISEVSGFAASSNMSVLERFKRQ